MAKFFVNFFRRMRNNKVMEHIPDNVSVLDVGCGSDFYLLDSIKDRIKSGIGIDVAVRSEKRGNITIKSTKVFGKLNFPTASFDVVTMIAFIEHLEKPEKILKECNRVLRKDGIIIITTPMKRAKPFWETLVKLGFTEEKTTDDHKQYFTPVMIENLLRKNGFHVTISENFEIGMNYIAVGKKA